jgi:AcrR family transcriptional regulator
VSPTVDTNPHFVSTAQDMKTRTYTMGARAEAVERTRQAILEAADQLTEERLTLAVSLADVADRAGVTVRTVLRHFGTREGLLDAVAEHVHTRVAEEREAPVGDVPEAVRVVVGHYEMRGDRVLRMLEEERVNAQTAEHVANGRRVHRTWVRTVFAPQLTATPDPRALEDLLVVATDVYTWKLLRRDAGLSRRRTEDRMTTMIRRLAEEGA